MEYTQVAANTFDTLQMNAGIICRSFDPETGIVSGILGTTSGGVQVNSNPSFADFGEDMDNVPGQTKQLKRVTAYDPAISGTLISVDNVALFSLQAGSFDFSQDEDQAMRIQPLDGAVPSGRDLWLIGDYSAVNDTDETIGAQAGFCAVHLLHALNNAGFQWQTVDEGKGQFAFEFHGHYDFANIDTVPYEIYVNGSVPAITVQPKNTGSAVGYPAIFTVEAIGGSQYQWQYSADDGETWSNSSDTGNNTSSVSVTVQATFDGYLYRCVVSNFFGSITSNSAKLQVKG